MRSIPMYHHAIRPTSRSGISNLEYGIAGTLIAIMVMAAITAIGSNTSTLYCHTASSVNEVQYSSGQFYYANSACDHQLFLSAIGLSGDFTLTQAYDACVNSNGAITTNIGGAGNINSCVVHAEQVRYNGDGNAMTASVGMQAIPAGLSSSAYAQANNALINTTNTYCAQQYPGNSGLQLACAVSIQNAAQSQNYSGHAWTPGNNKK